MSRYPTFGGNPLYPYDRGLLAGAPSLTREDRQAGYDINIIEQGLIPQAPAPTNPFTDTPTGLLNKELSSHPRAVDTPSPVPIYTYRWYKTKRGIAIIVLILLILISVIVGVAVGVTNEKQRQAALAATRPADVAPDSDSPSTVTSQPLASTTATHAPFRSTVKPTPAPTSISPTIPLIATSGTPQLARPSTPLPNGSVTPSQGGNAEQGRQHVPWYCKFFGIGC